MACNALLFMALSVMDWQSQSITEVKTLQCALNASLCLNQY
jgi:hypothetical protein